MTRTTDTRTTTTRSYRGPAGAGLPRLAGLTGVHRDETSPPQVIETERHDTDDRRLAAAGIALAVRRGDDEPPRWQLDLPDGDTPERLTVPLAPGAVDPDVPGELDELLRGTSRGRAVRPAGRLRTVRTQIRLRGPRGRRLGTVVHDEVRLAALGRSTEVTAWSEIRVDAGDALHSEIAERLADLGMEPTEGPAGEAELDRMLRPAPPARPEQPGRKASAGAVVLHHIGTQLDRLAAEDLRARRDEPDAVHQLRVASRRLRSVLQAYRPLLRRERTDPLVDALRELGRRLAPARDAEVLHERISAGLASLEPELLLGPVQAQVTRHFARVEAEARAAVLDTLDGEPYEALRRDLDELVNDPPWTKRAKRSARKELPGLLRRSSRRLDKAVAVATDPATPAQERDAAVHAARKAGKRLRYATEAAQPVVGKAGRGKLKRLQKALGEHQDTVVAREALRELGAAGENGFSFGVLHGREAARAALIERDLPALRP